MATFDQGPLVGDRVLYKHNVLHRLTPLNKDSISSNDGQVLSQNPGLRELLNLWTNPNRGRLPVLGRAHRVLYNSRRAASLGTR